MREEAKKPDGGFVLVHGWALVAAWHAVSAAILRPVDLRVWLATFEAVARRCGARKGTQPNYRVDELAVLTGSAVRTVAESVLRLRACGLVDFRREGVTHSGTLAELVIGDTGAVCNALGLVANHERRVPIPRRLVTCLARAHTPVLLATAFGHLLRCLYLRGKVCSSGGLCKAAWVAEVFGVSERSVKRARAELVRVGLLVRTPTPQHILNRWGLGLRWNLRWKRPAVAVASSPQGESHVAVTPPRRTGNSLAGSENQKPARGVPDGAFDRSSRGLGHVRSEDLRKVGRLRSLFVRATGAGLVRGSQADALNFAAAAAHAKRVGTRNPAGLFAMLVRRRLWSYISLDDEAQGRLVADRLLPERHRAEPQALHAPCIIDEVVQVSPQERERARRLILASLAQAELLTTCTLTQTGMGVKVESRWCSGLSTCGNNLELLGGSDRQSQKT